MGVGMGMERGLRMEAVLGKGVVEGGGLYQSGWPGAKHQHAGS